jgi:hypothetical protein
MHSRYLQAARPGGERTLREALAKIVLGGGDAAMGVAGKQ